MTAKPGGQRGPHHASLATPREFDYQSFIIREALCRLRNCGRHRFGSRTVALAAKPDSDPSVPMSFPTRLVALLGLAFLSFVFAASAAARNSSPVEFKVHVIESKIPERLFVARD
jgi:hypothetical protein